MSKPDTQAAPPDTFNVHVFPLELEQIAQHQTKVLKGLKPGLKEKAHSVAEELEFAGYKRQTRFKGAEPSTNLELMGLALSGGGIRSATFNLGVIQALAERGIFQHVDYISTVSGGGYLGSCLSSVLNRDNVAHFGDDFPFSSDKRGQERDAIKQLRNNSNYLAPRGFVDLIRIPALLLRGILINLLVLLPYIVLAVWITQLSCGEALRRAAAADPPRIENYISFGYWILIPFLAWIIISPVVQRFFSGGFEKRDRFERSFGGFLLAILIALVVLGLPTVLSGYHFYAYLAPSGTLSSIAKTVKDSTWWGIVASAIPFLFAGKASANVSRLRGKIVLAALGLLGPLVVLLIYIKLAEWAVYWDPAGWSNWENLSVVIVVVWLYTFCFVDVNKTSLHAFYRDRLSKAYLFNLDEKGCVRQTDEDDQQKLSKLNEAQSTAPYHLINCALNLQASKDRDLRGRNADFFIFSKYFVGGERTGYCPTEAMENIDTHLDLGTAMAISAAAAAPNMGTTTIKPLVFIMTLLNVRLGYWLPNPRHLKASLVKYYLKTGAGPIYLFNELLSRLNEKRYYVNVSDGGHLENLGIYELLRRRCKFIIASDAEADKNMSFGGLATLIRYARIDMGIDIEIELDEVRRNEAGLSRKKCSLGKIRYPGGETGHLLYVKSSVSGRETEYIREYRSRNVDFPHESTSDQFFDETQFEAYRALGAHTGSMLFGKREGRALGEDAERQEDNDKSGVIEKWFEELKSTLSPRYQMEDEFINLQDQLGEIDRAFADPDVAAYTYEIYPEIGPKGSAVDSPASRASVARDDQAEHERDRKIFIFCNLQVQLMENVFLALDLDNPENRDHYFNRGWMNLFRRWAQARHFRHAWAVIIGTFSVGFQKFCEDALMLQVDIRVAPAKWSDLSAREKQYLKERGLDQFLREEATAGGEYGYQIWLAELWIEPDAGGNGDPTNREHWDAFAIGCTVVRTRIGGNGPGGPKNHAAALVFYRIRNYYRQMRLLERMLGSLAKELNPESSESLKPRVVFSSEEGEDRRLYGYFFERCGFTIEPPG
ncbi:MAG: patatin-like phospholipase family protein [Acidobacteriota bacterium]